MTNWKTTLGGVAALLAGVGAAIKLGLAGDIAGATAAAVAGIGAFWTGLHAKDSTPAA